MKKLIFALIFLSCSHIPSTRKPANITTPYQSTKEQGAYEQILTSSGIKLNKSKLEGFCNLGSTLVYDSYDLELSRVLKKSIEYNPDPVYGKGYKYMNSLLEIYGWDKLISMLLNN